jgi:hypothetical protein
LDEIQGLIDAHAQFKATLSEADKVTTSSWIGFNSAFLKLDLNSTYRSSTLTC